MATNLGSEAFGSGSARRCSSSGWAIALATAAFALSPVAARADGTTPAFVGDFTDFNSPAWRTRWGIVPDTLTCKIAVGSAPCNWGYANLKAVDQPGTPGGAQALHVGYPAPSGPPSCGCGIGGAQLYQDLKAAGLAALAQSRTIDLKYYYNFPVGFDFGKSTGGKMPGLYGGPPGCESGGVRCDKAWSTRYMWRGGSASAPRGEVYFYTATGSGYGADLGLGNWNWQADGQWHSIEQLVELDSGKITVWQDGAQKFTTTQKFGDTPLTGIFFSTFHGGHDTGWSPSHATEAMFANFTLSTAGPQTDGAAGGGSDAAAGGGTGAGDAAAPGEVDAPGAAGGGTGGSTGSGGTGEAGNAGAAGSGGASGGSGSGAGGAEPGGSDRTGGKAPPTTTPPDETSAPPAHSGCNYAPGSRRSSSDGAEIIALAIALALARRPRRR